MCMKTYDMYEHDLLFYQNAGEKYMILALRDDDAPSPRDWYKALKSGSLFVNHAPVMACFHKRYKLGDDIGAKTPFEFWVDVVRETLKKEEVIQKALENVLEELDLKKCEDGMYEFRSKDPDLTKWSQRVVPEDVYETIFDWLTVRDCLRLCQDVVVQKPLILHDQSGLSISCGDPRYMDRWDSMVVGWIVYPKKMFGESVPENWKELAEEKIENAVREYDTYLIEGAYSYEIYRCGKHDQQLIDTICCLYGSDIIHNGLIDELDGLKEQLFAGKCKRGYAKSITCFEYIEEEGVPA